MSGDAYAMPLHAQSWGGYGATSTITKENQGNPLRSFLTQRNVFILTGALLLTVLCVVPLWNAVTLMQDMNYVFWQGRAVPAWIIGICLGTILVYVVTIFIFLSSARPQAQTEQTIMMIANIFITLFGLMLMIVSVPLSRQAITTYNNLMHKCDFSTQTQRLYEYSQVLHNIRATPACAYKYSVKECVGYEDAEPYTSFLQAMESDFRCSGFCYQPPTEASLLQGQTKSSTSNAVNSTLQNSQMEHMMSSFLSLERARGKQAPMEYYPPTLFSDANYAASCEGMAARDMKNFAGDIGFQTFYQGIYLVLIAIVTGLLKLIGLCVNRDRDEVKWRR